MTDESRGIEAAGPPWSVDLLADLHAGVLDEAQASRLWPQVDSDPEARAVIDALEATAADLAALTTAPAPPMPEDVAARIDAALAREAASPQLAPVVSLDAARRKRNRRIGWISGVVAVAAAAVAAVAIAIPGNSGSDGSGSSQVAQPTAGQAVPNPPLALRSDHPQAALGPLSQGVKDYGPFGTPQKLGACLQAAGFTAQADPIGVRPGTVDGKPAVLVLLTTGKLAEFRLVALSPDCGSRPLLDQVIGK
ncbi:hypothetical protein ORV05_32915 [Amycolatopsis cynarae]|uniref:Anti-sigma factor n=1 Tax=Amycolatopsis cynarae TaxID=2995223 RepID=A0ABY7B011_9PSEU|nr:hypothetical protein [Amycolatopsis sp. HUAS 11-8]WAL65629.1 hypothetical protein ORV05_32915 [Amycolatopsis sp. HUAS 11-8]